MESRRRGDWRKGRWRDSDGDERGSGGDNEIGRGGWGSYGGSRGGGGSGSHYHRQQPPQEQHDNKWGRPGRPSPWSGKPNRAWVSTAPSPASPALANSPTSPPPPGMDPLELIAFFI